MINLITGTPGSGKSYLAIKLLTEKYFTWSRKKKKYYRKQKAKKYTIFTNIDGFQLEHKNLNEIFQENQITFEQFFTVPYQEKIHKKYPHIIYVLDEVQQWLPSSFRNKDTIYYFDYHRHFGDIIWLITQDFTKITRNVNTLVELEYRAVKSTFSLFGEFRYNIKSNGQIFKRKTVKKDKRIFGLYRSFTGDDQEKHTNPLKYVIVGLIAAFIGLGWLFYDMITPDQAKTVKVAHASESTPGNQAPRQRQQRRKPKPEFKEIPIKSTSTVNNKLFMFVCPVTNISHFTDNQLPYQVTIKRGQYFTRIPIDQYLQMLQDNPPKEKENRT